MCGLQILEDCRSGNIGSDEITTPPDLLSKCILESHFSLSFGKNWTIGTFHTSYLGVYDSHFHQVTEPDSIAYKTSSFLVCQLSVAALNPYPGFTTEHQRADVCPSSQKLQVWGLWVACCYSVAQSCPTLCDPMDCSTPGLPVRHHLPELAQTHAH